MKKVLLDVSFALFSAHFALITVWFAVGLWSGWPVARECRCLRMRKMAQRQVQLSSLPQTREAQQQQETRESALLFFNSLGHLAQGDADLSQEESATLQR